ncbi:MAG: hypothetical protein GY808_11585 [Gammaproteobacteria bacterium]|nr:hypothetical protein [Gammaproteobacteria bacterium]
MHFFKLWFLLLWACTIQGCKTQPAMDSVAAIIPMHTTQSIAELRKIVDKALHGTPVTIAKTAFNKSNKLILQRKKVIGPDGRPIQTRVDEEPIIFELFITGDSCLVKDLRTNETFQLQQATCSTL